VLLKINRPVTVFIKFTGEMPLRFTLTGKANGLYYFRFLPPGTPRIKFNIVDADEYTPSVPIEVIKTTAIETPARYPELPPAERARYKDVTFKYNPDLKGTPARIYSATGIIEHGPAYYSYPKPIRLFIDLHEEGHLFYASEMNCDLWALVNYLRMGYNRSMAYYTLYTILGQSAENIQRLKKLLDNINVTSDENNSFKA
jgi:hypothetical protein